MNTFAIKTPEVIHEIFEDEVIVINLDNGNYYSLNQLAGIIWRWLADKHLIEEMVTGLATFYQKEPSEVHLLVNQFLALLQEEQLVMPHLVDVTVRSPQAVTFSSKWVAFEVPELQKYSDMQELLALDPIHEVDVTGWPKLKS